MKLREIQSASLILALKQRGFVSPVADPRPPVERVPILDKLRIVSKAYSSTIRQRTSFE